MRITTSVDFFSGSSNPSDTFDVRESRSAYRLRDNQLKNEDIFIWSIGTEGRLDITLAARQDILLPTRVTKVVMKIGDQSSYNTTFVQVKGITDGEIAGNLRILAALPSGDACLNTPCPFWGSMEKRYLPLYLLITIEFLGESKRSETFIKTIYFHVRKGSQKSPRVATSKVMRQSIYPVVIDGHDAVGFCF